MSAFQPSQRRARTQSLGRHTMFGVSFGLAAVVDVLLVGLVAFLVAANPLAGAAAVNLVVTPIQRQTTFSAADAQALAQQVDGVASASPVVSGSERVSAGDQSWQATVQGVDPQFVQIEDGQLAQGAFFTDQDNAAFDRVVVLGQAAAGHLFVGGQSPIGQAIRIRDVPFTVIGVASADPQQDNEVLVPFRTGQVRLFGATAVNEIVLQVSSADQASSVNGQVEQVLRQRHSLQPGQADDFTIRDAAVGGDGSTALDRMVRLTQQFGCTAKALCAPGTR